MLARISIVIDRCKALNMPMVIDADGLWHLTNNPNVIKGLAFSKLKVFDHLV